MGSQGLRWTMAQLQQHSNPKIREQVLSTLAENSLPRPKFLKESSSSPASVPIKGKVELNKTESRFLQRLKETYQNVMTQAIQLKLGPDLRYTPDFFTPTDLTFWEVKGAFIREDARAKFLAAVQAYPCFQFVMAQWKDGVWTITKYDGG